MINKIKNIFFRSPGKENTKPTGSASNKRYNPYADEAKLSKQRLYEKWVSKETWLLYAEGVPLILGLDPDIEPLQDEASAKKREELWGHAKECVEKKLLSVLNQEHAAAEWQVKPVDLYNWASISRIPLASELSLLMDFVVKTVKPVVNEHVADITENEDAHYQRHKEIVLGAATSLLINSPELCANSKGRVMIRLITKQIIENKQQWFGAEELLVTESAMHDLINNYVKLAKPLI